MVMHKVKVKLTKVYPTQKNVLIRLKYNKYINQVIDKMNIYMKTYAEVFHTFIWFINNLFNCTKYAHIPFKPTCRWINTVTTYRFFVCCLKVNFKYFFIRNVIFTTILIMNVIDVKLCKLILNIFWSIEFYFRL